jgi:hypothetical protein
MKIAKDQILDLMIQKSKNNSKIHFKLPSFHNKSNISS